MKQYKLVNNLVGWIVFAIAAFTYCSTVEPTASFWDCPEFITTANKLEVGHPPGAPFFMLTGNLFTHFAKDSSQVALMVNIMSALLSAFCILFLFWSITHLSRKLLCEGGVVESWHKTVLIMGCGLAGALAYTWSDTFWFSAVEGEVYAYSSMFTALVFWLILKWEDNADAPNADKWLVLIFYLTGLSIGVHLLNLLCLPAIVLVYYYRKYPNANLKGSLIALGLSLVLVAIVLYGVVPGIVKVGGWFELLFVNMLGLSFNTGVIIYILALVFVVLAGIYYTTRDNRKLMIVFFTLSVALLGIPFFGSGVMSIVLGVILLGVLVWALMYKRANGSFLVATRFMNTSLLCMLMLMIGYSSYSLIVLRSTQNPPMDQNSPEDIFTLGTYLNREQYGSRPLFYGQAYTSEPTDISTTEKVQRHDKKDASEKDKYDIVEAQGDYTYPSEMCMLFPRIYSRDHAAAYEDWLGGVDKHKVQFSVKDENGTLQGPYQGQMPSQLDNIRFFMSYQVNFMYWRYFMWNFAGRQNDLQSQGELEHGNWITGIAPIDNLMLGDQSKLPDELKANKGHNVFYCLPLLLGLIGLFWQAFRGDKGVKQFWVVFFLFFMTGLAIVLYLNQTPTQPRERDYAYAGSFYAFAIWIGLGVAGVAKLLERLKLNERQASVVASVICLLVPIQMVSQTWDDHDRSYRYACRDFGANYLNSLAEKGGPIIFTNGDNDTFPLWYNQEIEGVRTDARVCNLSYLQTDWYTDQMKRPAYNSPALPIDWHRYEYTDNMGHDIFTVEPMNDELEKLKKDNPGYDPFDIKFIIDNFVRNPELGFIPTDSIVIKVNKQAVRESGMLLPYGPDSIPDHISVSLKGKRIIGKNQMMVYEMLARSDWKRPMYMSVTLGEESYYGLDKYLVLEGLAYRITPFAHEGGEVIDADKMYDNMMNKFRYGNLNKRGIYIDETVMRMCYTHRYRFISLAKELLRKGERQKALAVMNKSKEVFPEYNVPYNYMSVGYDVESGLFELPEIWHQLGNDKESERILLSLAKNTKQYLDWYNALSDKRRNTYGREIERNFYFLQASVKGLERCKSKQASAYKGYMNRVASSPVGHVLEQRYMQQMQNMQQ